MKRYVIKRVVSSIIAILGAATVVFFLIRISGDPIRLMLSMEATNEQVEALRETMGYNAPLYIQYGRFIINLFKGDFGNSLHYGQPALGLIIERIPATLQLAIAAILLASVLGILAGIVCAVRRNGFFDMIVSFFVLLGQSVPVFWLSILLIIVFAVTLTIFPTSGNYGLLSLVLPAIALSAYPAATITRLMRSSLLDVMNEDYIRTARAKGVAKWGVVFLHALKNAFIPVLTVIGLEFGVMLGGAVVTETIFAWPGVGRLMIQAVYNRDFPLVQACVLAISFIFVFVNLIVDLSYTLFDPRIKYN
ncbi:MAG: ABC transporter permease [Clostridiales bacterium GWC2_40_7]|nr:MAG: ABC transporter permease [Clostridiales bacterium GWC2_40_7]